MMNWIWLGIVVCSILVAAFSGKMPQLTQRSFASAKEAVELAISLVGVMAFWLGVMKVAEQAGLLRLVARWLRRPMRWLFPDLPEEHPAMSAMIMNLGANLLGLANAATPFGIKAMIELNRLNKRSGVATDTMCLFLAINTSGLALFPTGVMAARAAAGSQDPACIWLPTLMATATATVVGVLAAKFYSRLAVFSLERVPPPVSETTGPAAEPLETETPPADEPAAAPVGLAARILIWLCLAAFLTGAVYHYASGGGAKGGGAGARLLFVVKDFFSFWAVPALMGGLLLFGAYRRVKVYEALVEGAKEGFWVAVRIIPYLVAIMVAVAMLQASGAMDVLEASIGRFTGWLGVPAPALPMILIRPLSGSGAYGYMNSVLNEFGADSFVGNLVSVMQGSTETTLYVLAVYFGAVQISRVRHALAAGLTADFAGLATAVLVSHLFFG